MGFMSTGEMGNERPTGGFHITNNPDSISFYYKFDNSHNTLDSAAFGILFTKYDSLLNMSNTVDSYIVNLPGMSSWKFKSVAFTNLSSYSPDTANIIFLSSNNMIGISNNPGIGNNLTVDDVTFYYGGVGIPAEFVINSLKVYPNPASEYINLNLSLKENTKTINIRIYDMTGKLVQTENLNSLKIGHNNISVNINKLKQGAYILSLSDENRIILNKRFQVTK